MSAITQVNVLGQYAFVPSTRPTTTLTGIGNLIPIRSGAVVTLFVLFISEKVTISATEFDSISSIVTAPVGPTFVRAKEAKAAIPEIQPGNYLLSNVEVWYTQDSYWDGTNYNLDIDFAYSVVPNNCEMIILAVEGLPYLDCYDHAVSSSVVGDVFPPPVSINPGVGVASGINRFDISGSAVQFNSSIPNALGLSVGLGNFSSIRQQLYSYATGQFNRRVNTSGTLLNNVIPVLNNIPGTIKKGHHGFIAAFTASSVWSGDSTLQLNSSASIEFVKNETTYFSAKLYDIGTETSSFFKTKLSDVSTNGGVFYSKTSDIWEPDLADRPKFYAFIAPVIRGDARFKAKTIKTGSIDQNFFASKLYDIVDVPQNTFYAEITENDKGFGLFKALTSKVDSGGGLFKAELKIRNAYFAAYIWNPPSRTTGSAKFYADLIHPLLLQGNGTFYSAFYDYYQESALFKAELRATGKAKFYADIGKFFDNAVFKANLLHSGKAKFFAEYGSPHYYIGTVPDNRFKALFSKNISGETSFFRARTAHYVENYVTFKADVLNRGSAKFYAYLEKVRTITDNMFLAYIGGTNGSAVFRANITYSDYSIAPDNFFKAKVVYKNMIGLNLTDDVLILNRRQKYQFFKALISKTENQTALFKAEVHNPVYQDNSVFYADVCFNGSDSAVFKSDLVVRSSATFNSLVSVESSSSGFFKSKVGESGINFDLRIKTINR